MSRCINVTVQISCHGVKVLAISPAEFSLPELVSSFLYDFSLLSLVSSTTQYLFHCTHSLTELIPPFPLLVCLFFPITLCGLSLPPFTYSTDESRASSALSVPSSARALSGLVEPQDISVLGHALESGYYCLYFFSTLCHFYVVMHRK